VPVDHRRNWQIRGQQGTQNWIVRVVKFVAFAALVITVLSLVMRLWNWLTPVIFGWHVINFWPTGGLLILGKILIRCLPRTFFCS
jgi:hypothetical protein